MYIYIHIYIYIYVYIYMYIYIYIYIYLCYKTIEMRISIEFVMRILLMYCVVLLFYCIVSVINNPTSDLLCVDLSIIYCFRYWKSFFATKSVLLLSDMFTHVTEYICLLT